MPCVFAEEMKRDMTLKNALATIRSYKLADAEAHAEAVRESWREMSPWMPWAHADYSADDSRK